MTEWRSSEETLEVLATGAGEVRDSELVLEVMAHNPDSDPYEGSGGGGGRKIISPTLTASPTQIT